MPATERLVLCTLRKSNLEIGEILATQWELFQKCIPYSAAMMQLKDDISQAINESDVEMATDTYTHFAIIKLARHE